MARYDVELPEGHGEELKVSYDQTSEAQKVAKDAKKAQIEVPDGKDFVVESGPVRQSYRDGGTLLRAAEPNMFGVRPAGGLKGVPASSDVVTHPEDHTVEEITAGISKENDRNKLRALLKDERKGVKDAAAKRLEELK